MAPQQLPDFLVVEWRESLAWLGLLAPLVAVKAVQPESVRVPVVVCPVAACAPELELAVAPAVVAA